MTREELINFGEMFLEVNRDSKNSNTYEFIKKSIELLKQETCVDSISRQSVIKEILRLWNCSGDKDYCMETLRDFVSELPPVTSTQKWILTSEQQPEENGNYLAIYRTSDGTASMEFMMVDHCNAGGCWLHEEKGRKAYKKVIAWMPLPESFSEVEE